MEATEEAVGVIMGDTLTATEAVVGVIMGDMLMATAMAITGDMDMGGGVILIGGAIPTDGVIRTGGVIPMAGVILTGGITLTILTMTPTTILITMRAMEGRRCFHKGLLLRRSRDTNNLLIGIFVRAQRVITPTLKIARVVG